MKRLLNTLYVLTQECYLGLEGETVAVRQDRQTTARVPLHTLDGIVGFGQVTCSPSLLFACAERNITVSFMSLNGRFQARLQGPVSGNVLLRRTQYRRADDSVGSAEIAQAVVAAKVANGRTALLRAVRDHPHATGADELAANAAYLNRCLEALQEPLELDVVRGVEGEAGQAYFSVFDHLIVAQKESFFFHKRSRRPPLDNVNALLSFLYAILAHDACSALEGVGLDPQVGFLHRDRPGRPSLALGLTEEVRPVLADRLALSLINRQQVRPSGFTQAETGAVKMDDETRKAVVTAYQKRKQEQIGHPFLGEQIPLGLLLHAQALLMARYLRGDLDAYPPFFSR
jgi:CRISP-associated protein Cas1